jgi:glycosyltransferase involved in cell wall biosynthesis
MKNITVWVVNQFAGTLESGWGERHFYFARNWVESGINVKIISSSYNHMFKKNIEVKGLYKEDKFQNIPFVWLNTPRYNPRSWKRFLSMLIFSFNFFIYALREKSKPHVIVVSSMPIFPILPSLFLRSFWNVAVVFEIRDIWPLTLQYLGKKSSGHPVVRFIGWFEKLGYKKSDAVVSLLPSARDHIEQVAGKVVTFHYIPNGITPDASENESLPIEISELIPNGKLIVGYAGTVGLANALEYFIEASTMLKERSDIFFILVGDGYLKEDLKKKTESQSNILFLPKIPKRQVQDLLSRFDLCFVGRNNSPLYKHGVSANKYFDYMLASKPILDANNYIKDPVELSGCGIIVEPDSAIAIKSGVLKFLEMSNDERQKMGALGREYVIKNHNIGGLSLEYISLFEKILDKPNS